MVLMAALIRKSCFQKSTYSSSNDHAMKHPALRRAIYSTRFQKVTTAGVTLRFVQHCTEFCHSRGHRLMRRRDMIQRANCTGELGKSRCHFFDTPEELPCDIGKEIFKWRPRLRRMNSVSKEKGATTSMTLPRNGCCHACSVFSPFSQSLSLAIFSFTRPAESCSIFISASLSFNS